MRIRYRLAYNGHVAGDEEIVSDPVGCALQGGAVVDILSRAHSAPAVSRMKETAQSKILKEHRENAG